MMTKSKIKNWKLIAKQTYKKIYLFVFDQLIQKNKLWLHKYVESQISDLIYKFFIWQYFMWYIFYHNIRRQQSTKKRLKN